MCLLDGMNTTMANVSFAPPCNTAPHPTRCAQCRTSSLHAIEFAAQAVAVHGG
jgi:predicted hotdog family 3-hydroxylacyl-ACP dehydratase